MRRARERMREAHSREPGFADFWYIDDGQVFCRPEEVDPLLRILDEELVRVGASRGHGPNVKSVARLVGACATVSGEVGQAWATPYIRDTCRIAGGEEAVTVLAALPEMVSGRARCTA